MRYDAELLAGVERGDLPPTFRFFRFKEPTVSFGRLQKRRDIQPLVPKGWPVIQRPTGGGIVFHENDFCLSLCWPNGLGPLPKRPQDQYRWIHAIILDVLTEDGLHMAACCDVAKPEEPFLTRACFTNPVGYDLLKNKEKKVGGALRCTRRATLYQGAIHLPITPAQEERLQETLLTHLAS
jgi:lipoate-protein ligase A